MISNVAGIKRVRDRSRWDFASYDPKYERVLKQIHESKWKHVALKDLVEFFKYGASIPPDYVDDGILFLRAQNIREQGIDLSDVRYIPDDLPNLDRYRLEFGDIVITRSGVNVGDAAAIPESLTGSIHGSYSIRLRLGTDKVSSEYLAIALNSSALRTQVFAAKGRSAQPNINIAELSALQVPLPPRPIQDRIAQLMQDAYATRRERLAEAESFFKTMDAWAFELLGVSFTSFAPPHIFSTSARNVERSRWDVSYHRPLNPIFADDNIWCSFEQYAKIVRDTFTPSKQASRIHYYVGIQNMSDDPYSTDDNALTLSGDQINGLCKRFHGGDILLARLGPTLGNKKSVIVPEDIDAGCCSPEFLVIRPRDTIDGRFLLWLVKADFLVEQMLAKTRGATPSRTRLYADDLLQLRVPKVSPSQQQTIGQELERRRAEAKRLRAEAEIVVTEAKARVERVILGQEEISG